MRSVTKHIVLFFVLTIAIGIGKTHAQYSEYEIKAAYIFNFAKFISWNNPDIANDTLSIAIYKNDPFGVIIDKTITGRKANGKYWKIIRTSNIEDIYKCNYLFISDLPRYEYIKIFEKIKNHPIITVGDEIDNFCEDGGMINFTPQYSKHRFEINNNAAKRKGIIISPKLLVLSKIISFNEDEF